MSFCSRLPNIPQKSWRRTIWRKPTNAKRFAFEANAITFDRLKNKTLILGIEFLTVYLNIKDNDLFSSETLYFVCTFNEDMIVTGVTSTLG